MAADSIPSTVLQHVEDTAGGAVWLVGADSIPSTVQRTTQRRTLPYYAVVDTSTTTVWYTRRGYYVAVCMHTLGLCVVDTTYHPTASRGYYVAVVLRSSMH